MGMFNQGIEQTDGLRQRIKRYDHKRNRVQSPIDRKQLPNDPPSPNNYLFRNHDWLPLVSLQC